MYGALCLFILLFSSLLRSVVQGVVTQSTGEDWSNCSVSLSTSSPSIKGSPPAVPSRSICFKKKIVPVNAVRRTSNAMKKRASGFGMFGSAPDASDMQVMALEEDDVAEGYGGGGVADGARLLKADVAKASVKSAGVGGKHELLHADSDSYIDYHEYSCHRL